MTIGERIKSTRKNLGYNAEFIADKIGVSRSTIYRYEKGEIEKVPGDVLVQIAEALNTTPAYLMGWEDEEPAAGSDRRLTKNEEALLTLFRTLPPEAQAAYLRRLEESLKTLGLV